MCREPSPVIVAEKIIVGINVTQNPFCRNNTCSLSSENPNSGRIIIEASLSNNWIRKDGMNSIEVFVNYVPLSESEKCPSMPGVERTPPSLVLSLDIASDNSMTAQIY